jgi:tetratricopeptide (TPR) repeat protein
MRFANIPLQIGGFSRRIKRTGDLGVGHEATAQLRLLGAFALLNARGVAVSITSKKSRALLALLALAPHQLRTRSFLQTILWCRCDKDDAQGNLRRELSTLNAQLAAADAHILNIERETIGLRTDLCSVDVLQSTQPTDSSTLLEGLDLAGEEEFEDWLRTERLTPRKAGSPPSIAHRGATQTVRDHRFAVSVTLEAWHNSGPNADLVPEFFRQSIAEGLQETGFFQVFLPQSGQNPQNSDPVPDVEILLKTIASPDALRIALSCRLSGNRALLFSMQDGVALDGAWEARFKRVREVSAAIVERTSHACLRSGALRDQAHAARKEAMEAIHAMFALDPGKARDSRARLKKASEFDDQGVFDAWSAYQINFLHDVSHGYDYKLSIEETRDSMAKALDREPFNGIVLSLCAHIHAFILHDLDMAWELIERAVAIGTQHVMHLDALSLLQFYSGRYDEARIAAQRAAVAGRHLPFRYCFTTTLCMIETMAGRHDEAVSMGLRAIAQQPIDHAFTYPPILRYLAMTKAHHGERDAAASIFRQLGYDQRDIVRLRHGPSPSAAVRERLSEALKLAFGESHSYRA